jgi:galactokinase
VNLIGDHTDYNLGLALPMAIDLGIDVRFTPDTGERLRVRSDLFPSGTELPLRIDRRAFDFGGLQPSWARLIAAMVALSPPETAGTLEIASSLPAGAGLSSSAALSVALVEVFGHEGTPEAIARLCQHAERLVGAPVGAMDPLVCAGATSGHALLIDFSTLASRQVPLPAAVEVVVVDSGQRRTVRSSAYSTRVAECEAAAAVVGPLGLADPSDLTGLGDPLLRRRGRHVVSECRRVRDFSAVLDSGDLVEAGRLMSESHRSLAADFEVSTPLVDDLVESLQSIPGVFGARMTGAGFGGCVVALSRPDAVDLHGLTTPAWRVRASDGSVARRHSAPTGRRPT